MSASRSALLDEARIVATALELADAGGQVPTIRAIATALGCSPMALYRHVPDKTALVRLLLEQVYAELDANPELDRAPDEATALQLIGQHAHHTLARHRWFPTEASAQPPSGPRGFDYTEKCLTVLTGGIWSVSDAANALGILMTYVIGAALLAPTTPLEAGDTPAGSPPVPDPQRWPLTLAQATTLEPEHQDRFNNGLHALIRGLVTRRP